MTAIVYSPVVQEYIEPEIDCVVAETKTIDNDENPAISSENLALNVNHVESIVIFSGQTAETEMSSVTLLKSEPLTNHRDGCDEGIPPIQNNGKVRRLSLPNINEKSDYCEKFKQQLSEKSKKHLSVTANINSAHNPSYPSSS